MFPRKMGLAWEILAPAKLNLYLEILNRQASGYHELETLMIPVRLYDQLLWEPTVAASGRQNRLALHVVNSCVEPHGPSHRGPSHRVAQQEQLGNLVPAGSDNLVLRAANLLARRAGVCATGVFTLRKRIPTCAGLGGGSSDAAAALALANAAWGVGYSTGRLMELAAELGSDVPFFLAHGAAICRGRGERVETVGSLGRLHFVVVKPPAGLSTAEVFARVARNPIPRSHAQRSPDRLARLIAALRCGDLGAAAEWMTNRLEEIAETMGDFVTQIHSTMKQCGCRGQWLTGSGSAYVGLVRSAKQARHVAGMLTARNLGTVFPVTSC